MGVRYPAMSDAQRDEVLAVDVVVVGAGAAGLYAALTAAERGGRVARRERHAARPDGELLGAGRPRRGARRRRLARAASRRHRAAPAAG